MRLLLNTALVAALAATGCTPPGDGKGKESPSTAGQAQAAEAAATGASGAGAGATATKDDTRAPPIRVARRVEVETLTPVDFDEMIDATAAVEALDDVTLSAQASGTIKMVLDKGEMVEEGQIVARLDDGLARAAMAQANAATSVARAALQLATDTRDRQKPLFEQKVISPLEYQNIEASVVQTRAQVEQARAGQAQALVQLGFTKVKSPIAGRVEQRFSDPGEQINPGQPVLRIVDNRRVKVVAGVPERYAPDMKVGAAVDITFNAYGVSPRRGEVSFVGSAIDPQNRTFDVEVILDNKEGLLKPQMIGELRVVRARHPQALVVPLSSVVRDERGNALFIAEERDGGLIARRQQVKLGARSGNRVEVVDGLEAGQRVVVVGQAALAADDPIEIVTGETR